MVEFELLLGGKGTRPVLEELIRCSSARFCNIEAENTDALRLSAAAKS